MCLYSMDKYLVEETKESQSFVEKALSIKKKWAREIGKYYAPACLKANCTEKREMYLEKQMLTINVPHHYDFEQ